CDAGRWRMSTGCTYPASTRLPIAYAVPHAWTRSGRERASPQSADPSAGRLLRRPDDWTNLDRADAGRRHLGRIGDRLVLVLCFDDVEADDLVAAGGDWARRGFRRSVSHANGGRGSCGLY